jgi:hypothetical protein
MIKILCVMEIMKIFSQINIAATSFNFRISNSLLLKLSRLRSNQLKHKVHQYQTFKKKKI